MRRPLSHKWEILIAFMLGNAVNGIAIDYSDYLYYHRLASGIPLTGAESVFYFTWTAFILYAGLAAISYLLGKYTGVRPMVILWLYLFIIVSSVILLQTIPAYDSSGAFQFSIWAGFAISVGIWLGLRRRMRR